MLRRDSAVWAAGLKRDSYPGGDRLEVGARLAGNNTWESGWDRAAPWYASVGSGRFSNPHLATEH